MRPDGTPRGPRCGPLTARRRLRGADVLVNGRARKGSCGPSPFRRASASYPCGEIRPKETLGPGTPMLSPYGRRRGSPPNGRAGAVSRWARGPAGRVPSTGHPVTWTGNAPMPQGAETRVGRHDRRTETTGRDAPCTADSAGHWPSCSPPPWGGSRSTSWPSCAARRTPICPAASTARSTPPPTTSPAPPTRPSPWWSTATSNALTAPAPPASPGNRGSASVTGSVTSSGTCRSPTSTRTPCSPSGPPSPRARRDASGRCTT